MWGSSEAAFLLHGPRVPLPLPPPARGGGSRKSAAETVRVGSAAAPAMPFLETRGLSKRFPGVVALDHIDFEAEQGEVRAIVGANGAGKSTLMNILSGVFAPSGGEIALDGRPVAIPSPRAARSLGISTVFQEFSSIPELSVAENLYLGREPIRSLRLLDRARLFRQARELLDRHHIGLDPAQPVEELNVAQRQLVELARALSFSARVLILDEPSAVLSVRELDNLFAIMARLRLEGLLILYVSHRLEEVFAISDRITVLRDGHAIATLSAAGSDQRELVRLMTGRESGERAVSPSVRTRGTPLLEVGFPVRNGVSHFSLHAGEILGLAGLVGAGRTRLARSLAGLGNETEIRLDGRPISIRSPWEALRHGIVYLTEDRKRDGIFRDLSVLHNASAAALSRFSAAGVMRPARERQASRDVLARLRLVARSLEAPMRELSGGNQQKVLLARALLAHPRILICDEPTRGIDVGAKEEIYAILAELAGHGVGIILIASELKELLGMAHRLLVMRDGAILADMTGADEHAVVMAAAGAAAGFPGPNFGTGWQADILPIR